MEYSRYQEPGWRVQGNRLPEPVKGSAITWFLVGMGIGAGIALVLAPTSGRELRGAIGRGCRRTFDEISRGARQLRRRSATLLNFNRRRSKQKIQQG
ncbi:MAG TPA: YtxH domain-containing protein [Candidatus Angelobacter sp.]|nr:YtxH domain-containing protein [Candidatus Angelobacter sp.]